MADNDDGQKIAEMEEEQRLEEEAEQLKKDAAQDLEMAKFAANAFDRASTSLVTVAVFTPLIGVLYKVTSLVVLTSLELVMAVGGCFGIAVALHLMGRGALAKGFK